ncbi:MAG: FAD-dependent oxidoreductase [Candidatus Methanosuratincola sp.]|jgi:thioredoxin-disulfide reductase|nr:FAD-dependent oxidoreductase [Candidatus Methanosuratincola sp.]
METYDVIIIGGGPAGVSAAIYAKRKLLRTVLISKEIGGQVLLTSNIENYPGFVEKSGIRLGEYFEQQLKELGVEIVEDMVREVRKEGNSFRAICEEGREFLGKSVIATGGSSHKKLNVPGEGEFFGRGVYVCATCDAPLTKNKTVAVVGGGNAAFQSADLLARYAAKVYLIHHRGEFRADGLLVNRVKGHGNVEVMTNVAVREIRGKDRVDSLLLENLESRRLFELPVQKVFIEIGREVKADYLKGLVLTNQHGQVIVDRLQRTSCGGIFAAGEITDLPYGQAIISAGQGAVAALAVFDYLSEKKS